MFLLMVEQDSILLEIEKRLIEEFHPSLIYLFGSKARGDQSKDSDYDLLLVVPSEIQEPQYRRMQRAQKVLWGVWTAVDVIILTEREFAEASQVKCSLPATVVREGVKLYAA
jgi:hypothetical protein